MTTLNKRYERGLKNLRIIDKEAGEKVVDSLNGFSPDLVKYMIEYSFGDVYNRTELALQSKELTVVAALTAMGNAAPQLKVHIHGALNVGCNIAEIQEVILQMSSYSGFPNAINGMLALKDVVADRKEEGKKDDPGIAQSSIIPKGLTRYELGAKNLRMLNPNQVENLEQTFREMATIAALTAMGTAPSQLKFHIKAALNIGVSEVEIREIMILMSVYAGFPSSINGTLALKEVINEKV